MFAALKRLLFPGYQGDERRRHESEAADSARMLEMDEPMAGAGAQLSGRKVKSETEKALDRASRSRRPAR